ncbi:hypothetical protein NA57DRAFT_60144 [Rhizodiscina lignyota]|uniref:Uncharacterized protein n=1 Tax=Rhizodiscina lignyota TaxID=1504668 RepID=A0A9P4IAH6_9PEZI|nr:hypothetical protein NA57DRAFT_60144 [Rhizodiscina lignyota]
MATQDFLLHQQNRFHPQIQLQRPLSPALSNPDLILPDRDPSTEIPRYAERPPSPSQIIRKVHSQGRIGGTSRAIGGSLTKAHTGTSPYRLNWQDPHLVQIQSHPRALLVKTPPLSRKSSNLEDIDELDATPTRADYSSANEALASSPALKENNTFSTLTPGLGLPKTDRRWSTTSSSVHSDDFESLESLKWPGFDGVAGEDVDEADIILDDEEEERFGSFPASRHENEGDEDQENWDPKKEEDEDDPYSPDALSRRADVILANAKRRLNLFEGNLRGARHSLPISQSMSMTSLRTPPDLPPLPTPPRDRSKYSGLSGPLKGTQTGEGGGHSRGHSDTSASSFIQQLMAARAAKGEPQRSVSALATHTAANQLRNTRSQEIMKENRIRSWVYGNAQPSLASPAHSEPSKHRDGIRRSPSTTNDLRSQMNELKGKISSLQQRAREENQRRRSLASTRTHSPFSDTEPLYQVNGYGNGSNSNLARSTDANTQEYAAHSVHDVDHNVTDMLNDDEESQYESAEEPFDDAIEHESPDPQAMMGTAFPDFSEDSPYASTDDGESVYESIIFDDETPVQPAERHEDRPDAFDYENFYLHSAMGSYSRGDRSSSVSSNESVETTKPASPLRKVMTMSPEAQEEQGYDEEYEDGEVKSPGRFHKRSQSTDSISTMATFMTATEGFGDDEDDDFNPLDKALPPLPRPNPSQLSLPLAVTNSLRDSAVSLSPSTEKPPSSSGADTVRRIAPSLSPLPLGSPSPSTALSASDSGSNGTHESVLMLSPTRLSFAGSPIRLQEEDQQLVLALAKSLEKVCLALRDTETGQYEGKIFRRRLDEARRALDGVEEVVVNGQSSKEAGSSS